MLEAQPLDGIRQLDVDRQIVGWCRASAREMLSFQ
jgi:hypothetical protein